MDAGVERELFMAGVVWAAGNSKETPKKAGLLRTSVQSGWEVSREIGTGVAPQLYPSQVSERPCSGAFT